MGEGRVDLLKARRPVPLLERHQVLRTRRLGKRYQQILLSGVRAGWLAGPDPRADYRLRPHRRHCPGSRSRSRSSRPRLQPGARAPAVDVDASGAGVKSAARDQHITGAIDIADRPHALAEGCALLGLRRGDLEDLILWGPRRAPSRPPARSIRQPRCPSPRGQWSTDRLSSAGQAPSRLVAPLAPASAHSADP